MKRRSLLGFFSDAFMIYGILTLLLNLLCKIFGDGAKKISTLFSLGSSGIATDTSLQFLVIIMAVSALRYVFMTDMLIKNMPRTARIVLMFISAFAISCGAVVLFGWFPVNMPLLWVLFIVCFAVSCTVSTVISYLAEKQENSRLDLALKKYKEEN